MKTLFRLLGAAAVLSLVASPVAAGELKLSIQNGRVTLLAQEVPVQQILAEWSRIGQTRIVNGEKLGGPPLTLQLQNVPEGQALEVVLRAAPGYMIVPRAYAAAGLSAFDRVLILPSTSAVTATGGSPSNPALTQQPPRPQPFSPNDTAPDESEAEVQEPAEEEQVIEEGVEGGQAMPTPALRPGMQVFPGQQNPNSPTPAPGVGMPGAARPGIMMDPQPQRPTFRNPYGMPNQLPPGAPPPPPPGAPPPEQR